MPCKFAKAVSETALTEFRSDYTRRAPDGREIVLSPHFIVGSGANVCRIYLCVDKEQRRYIIGHVGNHLRGARNPR